MVWSIVACGAAQNLSLPVDSDACHPSACLSKCEQIFGGTRRRNNKDSYETQKCYCSKACATMDCSSGFNIVNHDAMCATEPPQRRQKCQQDCQKASDKGAWVDFCNQGCDFWCDAKSVTGSWKRRYTLAGQTSDEWDHGTSKTHSESKTKEWSESVTAQVSHKFSFGKASISAEVQHSMSDTYSNEWTVSDTHKFTVTFSPEDHGKTVWQFVFDTQDSCNHAETTLSKDYAVTRDAEQPPCCLPGYAHDAPTYQNCYADSPNICKGEIAI